MKSRILLLILGQLTIYSLRVWSQTPGVQRWRSFETLHQKVSPFQGLAFRNIGPTIMSGRVTDLEVNPDNPAEFYVAYASGGVWYTRNNGQSFEPVFDQEASITIGDMAVDWLHHHVWVGTGEVNSSRSSYAGTGVYRSKDSGKIWQHLGLLESHHIGKVILHPKDTMTAWVAVLGHLYTPNTERGVYKTTDGGKTWKQTLYLNDTTGVVDLVPDPQNPNRIYAASWSRTRQAWQFNGQGSGSGIYLSMDGGENWIKLSHENSGFPQGNQIGRIGLAVCASMPSEIYALLDNQNNRAKDEQDKKGIKAKELVNYSREQFLALEDKVLKEYLKENGYPEKYTAEGLKDSVRNDRLTVKEIADWKLADADANLFDTPIIGAELYRSRDSGKTWAKTHTEFLDGVYYTYGYYFGTVQVSPVNPEQVYIAGYPLLGSSDGGKTFTSLDGDNCHPDYHRIWINPKQDQHMVVGNDGGVNITYDQGKQWIKANNPAVGQFYAVQVDEANPYQVYGGLQDNGTWVGSSKNKPGTAWHQSGVYPFRNIGDGDGMQVQVDTRDNQTVYVGYQFGNYFRYHQTNQSTADCKPIHDIGQKAYRFNWQTPILLSKHHQDIFYIGSQMLHRSLNKGEQLQTISEDLTANRQKGNIPYATLSTLSESPLRFGLLYAGSDDGYIHVSRDVGTSWQRISDSLPAGKWISRVLASRHTEGRVFATLNGYRQDDFSAWVFVSEDYGKHWQQIGRDLPDEPVNVIREDPKNHQILYVGTDNGLYVSVDGGQHFIPWSSNLPRVAIHDMVTQDRENELVLGTHGRSIYIASLKQIQQYVQIKDSMLYIESQDTIVWNKDWGKKNQVYDDPRQTESDWIFYTRDTSTLYIQVSDKRGKALWRDTVSKPLYGYNRWTYSQEVNPLWIRVLKPMPEQARDGKYYLLPGEYQLQLSTERGNRLHSVFYIREADEEENNP